MCKDSETHVLYLCDKAPVTAAVFWETQVNSAAVRKVMGPVFDN